MADPYYRLRARVRERSVEMVQYAADALAHAIDQTTPVASGKLKASQRVRISAPSADDRVSVSISYDVPYARAIDLGRDELPIFPKNKKAMQFLWENPRWDPPGIFTFKKVVHPGLPKTEFYSQWVQPDIWQAQLERAERDLTK